MKKIGIKELPEYDINPDNVVCISQSWSQKRSSWSYLERPRPCDGLIYVLYGSAEYISPTCGTVRADMGDVLYLPRGSRYYVRFDPADARSLLINFNMSVDGEGVVFDENVLLIGHDDGGTIGKRFEKVCNEYPKTLNRLKNKAELLLLFDDLAQITHPRSEASRVGAALDYINAHLDRSVSVGALAKLCAMSESTFRREFKRSVGVGPIDYINDRKIKKAEQMLRANELSIDEICLSLNFYDTAYFHKVFKEKTGMTPGRFRTCEADL